MKGIILFVLFFISTAFSYDYIKQVNDSDFNLNNVTCQAERRAYSDPYVEFIIIYCDDMSEFSANVSHLVSNSCSVEKVVGSNKISYGIYYVNNSNIYESITDEFGIDISVKKVYIDCISIYKKFKSKVIGKVRNSKFKCKSGDCYIYYDDGTKVKYKSPYFKSY